MTFEVTPLAGAIGAVVGGADLGALDDATFAEIRRLMAAHCVLAFRDQDITPGQLLEFAKRWGDVHLHPYLDGLPEHPEIIEIVKNPEDTHNFGDHWHTDQIFSPTPAIGTMLHAKEVPSAGGDTLFANMYACYDALSEGMKEMLAGLRTYNLYDKTADRSGRMRAKIPDKDTPAAPAIHPLVRTHPETGRPALYLTDRQTTRRFAEMSEAESAPLLDFLLGHATRPEFTCRLRWEVGTLALWDNRCVLHTALDDYPGHRRVMHRITIKGEATG